MKKVSEWDKTFPKSEKVDHEKVTFVNRYGITLAADLYKPKNAFGKYPAIEDYTESPSCIELEKDRCISTEVVSETDPFYEDLDGEYDYATDVCPDCGSPIGIANDGGNGFCINCAPNH